MIFEFQRQRQQEKKQIKSSLEDLRKVLPACYSVLVSYTAAAELAIRLNTTLRAGGDASGAEIGIPKLQTPAESVRGRVRRQGFESLDLEEKKFCLLDQALNPQKYEFLREEEEEENIRRMKVGLMPLIVKHSAPVERFRLKKHEIDHILETPMSMLTDRDKHVRRILKRFHDDPELLMKGFAEVAYGYDATRRAHTGQEPSPVDQRGGRMGGDRQSYPPRDVVFLHEQANKTQRQEIIAENEKE